MPRFVEVAVSSSKEYRETSNFGPARSGGFFLLGSRRFTIEPGVVQSAVAVCRVLPRSQSGSGAFSGLFTRGERDLGTLPTARQMALT